MLFYNMPFNVKLIVCFFYVFFAVNLYSINKEDNGNKETEITWYPFEWLPSDSDNKLENPHAIIRFNPTIEGVPGLRGFQMCLDIADTYIYESAFESLLWRKPDLDKKVLRLHAAGRTQTRVLEDVEIVLGGDLLGYNDIKVIDSRNEPEDINISGFFGYNFFRSIEKIVVVDYGRSRFALLDNIPDEWQGKAHMVSMQTSPSFMSLSIRANSRRIRLSFDMEPNPALVLYRNRDFKRIASEGVVKDSLRYFIPHENRYIMLEGKPPKVDLYFGPYKLKSHNVYLMDEKDHRIGGDRGLITPAFFEDYILIVDFKNDRFGIMPP